MSYNNSRRRSQGQTNIKGRNLPLDKAALRPIQFPTVTPVLSRVLHSCVHSYYWRDQDFAQEAYAYPCPACGGLSGERISGHILIDREDARSGIGRVIAFTRLIVGRAPRSIRPLYSPSNFGRVLPERRIIHQV
jgi:hypothetical protein